MTLAEIEKKYGIDFGSDPAKDVAEYLREKGWNNLADLI